MSRQFKPGHDVYATKNSVWGNAPMKVVRITDDFVTVDHPTMGRGAFRKSDLKHASTLSNEAPKTATDR